MISSLYDKLKSLLPFGKTCDKHPDTEMVGYHIDVWCPHCEKEIYYPSYFSFVLDYEYELLKAGSDSRCVITTSVLRAEKIVKEDLGLQKGEICYIIEVKPNYYPFSVITEDDGSFDANVSSREDTVAIDTNKPPLFILKSVVAILKS